jgi:hypothetical protein
MLEVYGNGYERRQLQTITYKDKYNIRKVYNADNDTNIIMLNKNKQIPYSRS